MYTHTIHSVEPARHAVHALGSQQQQQHNNSLQTKPNKTTIQHRTTTITT